KLYYDLSTFGQAPLFIEEDADDILRGTLYPVGSYALTNNARGQVNGLWRECGMTVAQLVQRFGLKRCSAQVQTLYKNVSNHEKWVDLLHLVTERSGDERGARRM